MFCRKSGESDAAILAAGALAVSSPGFCKRTENFCIPALGPLG